MSPLPRYDVIYRDLLRQIKSGGLPEGKRLQSEHELAATYSVSRMTVRQALDRLAGDGAVLRLKGSGTFVAPLNRHRRELQRLRPLYLELGVEAHAITTKVLFQGLATPTKAARTALNLADRDTTIRIRRCRGIHDQPVAIQDSWLPYGVAPDLVTVGLIDGSLYSTLSERYGIRLRWAEQSITASAASAEQGDLLCVDRGSPLIASTRVAYCQNSTPIEYSMSWTRPDYPLVIRLES